MCLSLHVCVRFLYNVVSISLIDTLSLHDALPIFARAGGHLVCDPEQARFGVLGERAQLVLDPRVSQALGSRTSCARSPRTDRKSTRLNSSHQIISYAVFCLKKKKHKGSYQDKK